jgi:hypothetical protein
VEIPEPSRSIDAAAITLAKIFIALVAFHFGFTHVSDDDYARTVISERFAFAPSFDPSGTSWLPFPFWITGTAMMAFGRSIDTAVDFAIFTSAITCAFAYLALRAARVERVPALLATLLAMALPWSAWLGAANVPEGFTPQLMFVGMVTVNAPSLRARTFGGLALLAASLSRYEAWPICALFFLAGLAAPLSPKRIAAHALPMIGPAAWMAWNLHAHGSATHFLTRVAAYRDAIGMSDATFSPFLFYPKALLAIGFEPILLGFGGLIVVCMRRDVRQRWAAPLFACVSMFGFLIYGESRGGAPTHHPERAVLAAAWVLIACGLDGILSMAGRHERLVGRVSGMVLALWAFNAAPSYADAPGKSADENRGPQLARGNYLRARDAKKISVVPCAYEHFALIAAFGKPERVDVAPIAPKDAATHTPNADCPIVLEN